MNNFFFFVLAVVNCIVFTLPVDALDVAAKEKMKADLDIIKNTFEVRYAPIDWKKTYAGWDIADQIAKAKLKLEKKEKVSIKEYQKILNQVFKSARDYHVKASFYSTEAAFLPFRLQGSEGRYFLAWVDQEFLKQTRFPWRIGDEVVLFDGKSVGDVIEGLKHQELGNPESLTDQALAEMILTARIGSLGHAIPRGTASVSIKHAGSTKAVDYSLAWEYSPERIDLHFGRAMKLSLKPLEKSLFYAKMYTPIYDDLSLAYKRRFEKRGEEEELLGKKKSFLPPLGRVLWEPEERTSFHAYIFEGPNTRPIGYIRIPHYSGSEKKAKEFEEIIACFEKRTDALVIDQVNNPGGYVLYMYALASMLSDRPMHVPAHRMTLTQEDVYSSLEGLEELAEIQTDMDARNAFGETILGYPMTVKFVRSFKKYLRFIVDEWNKGKYFTDSFYLEGIKTIQPNPKAYTKPIAVLINSLDFSCGDFFPAILQDNKRAVLFGTKTAGAGGFVMEESHPNCFGIAGYTITRSIAERSDQNPIENLGVSPDVFYEVSALDLTDNYRGYVQAVLNLIDEKLLKH